MKNLILILFFITLVVLSSCGPGQDYNINWGDPYTQKMNVSTNAVKYISPGITDARATNTYQLPQYQLGPSGRLLLRLENFLDHANDVFIDDTNRMHFVIHPTSAVTPADFENDIKICPLTKNWMMLATWHRAHPFPGGGDWARPGGDYDDASCVTPDIVTSNEKGDGLYFDISDYFEFYIRSRKSNLGFIIIANKPITIYGENHTSLAPKMSWTKIYD